MKWKKGRNVRGAYYGTHFRDTWLGRERFLKQEIFGRAVRATLDKLERDGANIDDVIETIALHVLWNAPSRIPVWLRSEKEIQKRVELLDNTANLLPELFNLHSLAL